MPFRSSEPEWAALGHDDRSAALLKAADAVERSAEELAQLLSPAYCQTTLQHGEW